MFEIDMKSRRSIYEQVMDNLKELILTGVIAPNAKLPSVRDLSKTLTVNPNTVQKSFRELERQGYIYTVSGKGSFATSPDEIGADSALIAESSARLSDDLKELYYLTHSVEKVRGIVEAALSVLPEQTVESVAARSGKESNPLPQAKQEIQNEAKLHSPAVPVAQQKGISNGGEES